MGRLQGFDYRRPFHCMVTPKRRAGPPGFSAPAPRGAEGRMLFLPLRPTQAATDMKSTRNDKKEPAK